VCVLSMEFVVACFCWVVWSVVVAQLCVCVCVCCVVLCLCLGLCFCVGCDVCFRAWRDVCTVWIGICAVASVWVRASGCVCFVVL